MKTRDVLFYVISGAALGVLGGAAAAASVVVYARRPWWAIGLFALAGAIVSSAGAGVTGSRRAAFRDSATGFMLAGAGFFALAALRSLSSSEPQNVIAVGLVFFSFVFSAALGASHAWSLRERDALPAAALFAGVGGLFALAAAMKVLSQHSIVVTGAVSGALYGALVWCAVGVARRLFSVDIGQFRV